MREAMDMHCHVINSAGVGDEHDNVAKVKGAKKTTSCKRARCREGTTNARSASCSGKQKLGKSSRVSTSATGSAIGRISSSRYRGVTRHRWTGRYEAHLWDKNVWNQSQSKKGRQGAYDDEDTAAHAYDMAALKYWGPNTILNFPIEKYEKATDEMQNYTREEYIASLRRKSNGFSRGVSKYRGVARHHHNGRWEARIGRVDGNKYLYLGTYGTQEEAAIAYDIAAIQHRGLKAVTNFDMSNYLRCMKSGGQLLMNILPCTDGHVKVRDNNAASSRKQASAANTSKVSSFEALQLTDAHQHYLAQVCMRMMLSDNNSPCYEDIKQRNLTMQLENILGSSDVMYGNHIQDQASATYSIPVISFDGSSQLATQADPGQSHLSHLLSSSARVGNMDADNVFDRSHQINTALRLDKLMAEYNELLQSSPPKNILEKVAFSAFADTLSDTASSSTSSSKSSASVHLLNHDYLNCMIKPGGYVAGLLSPEEECMDCVKPRLFEVSDIVTGSANDSICSSNEHSSMQELVTCSMSDPTSSNNGLYPIQFSPYTPNEADQMILDSRLNDSLVCLLPPHGTFYQYYLQK
ncbi:hypothetical protein L7F22_064674 [Adiantum nelumboides]|nr:hypothetical protein [Adiantum nelumboides]